MHRRKQSITDFDSDNKDAWDTDIGEEVGSVARAFKQVPPSPSRGAAIPVSGSMGVCMGLQAWLKHGNGNKQFDFYYFVMTAALNSHHPGSRGREQSRTRGTCTTAHGPQCVE